MFKDKANSVLPWIRLAFWPELANGFRPFFVQKRFLAYYVLLALAAKLIIFPFYFWLPQTSFFADVVGASVFTLTNQARNEAGLWPLVENPVLERAAFNKAQDMLTKGYFAHTSPQGLSPWYWFQQAGYKYRAAGENLAIGFVDSQEVVQAWQDSFSHRENLLSPVYHETGLAVVSGNFQGQPTTLVVQFFGTPAKSVVPKPVLQASPLPSVSATPSPSMGSESSTPSTNSGPIGPSATSSPVLAGAATERPPEKPSVKDLVIFSSDQYHFVNSWLISSLLLSVVAVLLLSLVRSRRFHQPSQDLVWETSFFVLLLITLHFLPQNWIVSLVPHRLMI